MRTVLKLARVVLLVSIVAAALLTVAFVQAQEATPSPAPPTESVSATATLAAGSAAQLHLRRPLLGMQLMDTADSPNYYQGLTLGGGEMYIALGGTCAAGYTNALPSLGMVWIGASGPLQVGFSNADPAVQTGVILWDQLKQQWWCTQAFSQDSYVQFSNLDQGIYFVWVLTPTSQTVQGDMFVRAAPAQ